MNAILACRNGAASYYVSHRLASKGLLTAVIIESGAEAKKKKIDRLFRRSAFWQIPGVILNLALLFVYQFFQERALRNFVVGENIDLKFPVDVQQIHVDDVNKASCEEYLNQRNPDYLIVMGTALLKTHIIGIPSIGVLNIHGGMVPKYRNVHSDFWAYIHGEHDKIGTSILYLDEGIDTGDIVCQSPADVAVNDGLFEAKKKNLSLAVDLLEKALTDTHLIDNREVQDKDLQEFFPTPGNGAFFRLIGITIRRKFGWY